jgi:hypothetical protein
MGGQPDAAKYEALIEQLTEIERRAAAKETDALTASRESLGAVIGFLHEDARVPEREATRPLLRLMFAVADRLRGAKPKLLFDPRDTEGEKGAPTYTSAATLRGYVNAAFLLLLEGGMSKQEAGNWLAAELERSGIKQPNEKAITAKTIIRWRAERGGKSLKGSDEAFEWIVHGTLRTMLERSGLPQLPPVEPPDRRGAQLAARIFIRQLRIAGF